MTLQSVLTLLCCTAACSALVGCGEKPQTISQRKSDTQAFAGPAASSAYTAPGWKAGDATSWEEQMRNRSRGQNEYSRASAP